MHPAFQAGLRSACAVRPVLNSGAAVLNANSPAAMAVWPGLSLRGVLFAIEFLILVLAMDYVIHRPGFGPVFTTRPVWITLGAHFLSPAERRTRNKIIGLHMTVAGVILSIWARDVAHNTLWGDIYGITGAMI